MVVMKRVGCVALKVLGWTAVVAAILGVILLSMMNADRVRSRRYC